MSEVLEIGEERVNPVGGEVGPNAFGGLEVVRINGGETVTAGRGENYPIGPSILGILLTQDEAASFQAIDQPRGIGTMHNQQST